MKAGKDVQRRATGLVLSVDIRAVSNENSSHIAGPRIVERSLAQSVPLVHISAVGERSAHSVRVPGTDGLEKF